MNLHINFQEILYIENHNHTMYIHTINDDTHLTKAYSLTTLSEELDNDFIRCHKKYIVALRQIQAYDKATAMIKLGNVYLPVGRTFMHDLRSAFFLAGHSDEFVYYCKTFLILFLHSCFVILLCTHLKKSIQFICTVSPISMSATSAHPPR